MIETSDLDIKLSCKGKSVESFWTELKEAIDHENPDMYESIDIHTIRLKNIEFPDLNEVDIKNNIDILRASEHEKGIKFCGCIFNKISFDFSEFSKQPCYSFYDCIFNKLTKMKRLGYPTINHCSSFDQMTILDSEYFFCTQSIFYKKALFDGKRSGGSYRFELGDSTFRSELELTNLSSSKHGIVIIKDVDLSLATLILTKVSFWKEQAFSHVVWPKPNNIKADRETFRQLKVCMEESRNAIQANVFHSLEMNEYGKELLKLPWYQNISDKAVFGANWGFSNFSLSWLLPLFWIALVSVGFYVSIFGWEALTCCGGNGFFHFINPLNRNIGIYQSVYAAWFLHKLAMIPLIYLFVVALKRKTKY